MIPDFKIHRGNGQINLGSNEGFSYSLLSDFLSNTLAGVFTVGVLEITGGRDGDYIDPAYFDWITATEESRFLALRPLPTVSHTDLLGYLVGGQPAEREMTEHPALVGGSRISENTFEPGGGVRHKLLDQGVADQVGLGVGSVVLAVNPLMRGVGVDYLGVLAVDGSKTYIALVDLGRSCVGRQEGVEIIDREDDEDDLGPELTQGPGHTIVVMVIGLYPSYPPSLPRRWCRWVNGGSSWCR